MWAANVRSKWPVTGGQHQLGSAGFDGRQVSDDEADDGADEGLLPQDHLNFVWWLSHLDLYTKVLATLI